MVVGGLVDRWGRPGAWARMGMLLAVLLTAGCASQDRPLEMVSGMGAIYPPAAKAEGVEGYVVVGYDVTREGRVTNTRVVRSSPPGVFDEAALEAVSRWRFNAPTEGGEPQRVEGLESRLDFSLGEAEAYRDY